MTFFYEECADMHFVYRVCKGNASAVVENYRLRYPRQRIPDRRVFTRVQSCSLVFTRVHAHLRERGSFPSVNRCAERQIQRNMEEDENIIDIVQLSSRATS